MDAKKKNIDRKPIDWIEHPAEGKVWARTEAESRLDVVSYDEAVKKGAIYIEIGKAKGDFDIFVRICKDECEAVIRHPEFAKVCKPAYASAKHQGAFFLMSGKLPGIAVTEIRPIDNSMPAVDLPRLLSEEEQAGT